MPEHQQVSIREWLRQPACRAFQQWIAGGRAAAGAELLNHVLDPEADPVALSDIKERIVRMASAIEFLSECSKDDYKFTDFDLRPTLINSTPISPNG
jgi:hypothetical protein